MAWLGFRTWVTGEFELSPGQEQAVGVLQDTLLADAAATVVLEGPAGTGKTVLAGYFAQFSRDFFRGGAAVVRGHDDIVEAATTELRSGAPSLMVVEEAHAANDLDEQLGVLRQIRPEVRVILLSQSPGTLPEAAIPRIQLAAYSAAELHSLAGLDLTAAEAARLQMWLGDRPLTPRTVIEALADGVVSPAGLSSEVEVFKGAATLNPDGRPASQEEARRAEIRVRDATHRLFEAVRDEPDLLQALTPREFEEVVAERFRRQGYTVDLTASSRDGGKDIYVAKTDELGSFLYMVECKAFSLRTRSGCASYVTSMAWSSMNAPLPAYWRQLPISHVQHKLFSRTSNFNSVCKPLNR